MVRIAVEDAGLEEDSRVAPDVVYNRFGVLYGRYTLLELEGGGRTLLVPLHREGARARLGLYLTRLSSAELEELCAFVFARFPVSRISVDYATAPLASRFASRNHAVNHWKLLLPATAGELWDRVSRKSRYNRRREEKALRGRLGGADLVLTEYGGAGEAFEGADSAGAASFGGASIPPEVVESFFAFKRVLMGREYGLSPSKYLSRYHVSHAYTWTGGGRLLAVVFCCEQGQDVFLENLSYDPDFEEFSPGFHLYALVLERLVAKGKRALFLGGGKQPYKARFGGTEDLCYNVEAYRNAFAALPYYAAKFFRRVKDVSLIGEAKGCAAAPVPAAGRGGFFRKAFRFVYLRAKYAVQRLFFSLVPPRWGLYGAAPGGAAQSRGGRGFSITVSLTSFPPRFATLHLCVKSLLRQTLRPDRIVLYLGTDCGGVPLPKKLLALQKYGLTVRTGCDDLRPHKKYIYAMREFPDDFIVTVDDDLLFRRDMLEGLWAAHLRHPGSLVASRVHLMRRAGGKILPYRDWLHETGAVRGPSHALLSTNGAGSLFPPRCLPGEALDGGLARRLCLNADDIWLKFMLLRGGTKVVWAGRRAGMPDEIRMRAEKKLALMDGNLTGDGNDRAIAALEGYFAMNLADYCSEGSGGCSE